MPAGAVAGAGLAGSLFQSNAASNAAKAQTRAAQIAAATQMQMYQQTRSDLAPYRDLGQYAGNMLQNRLTDLTSPVVMDQATLEATPGYRFNLSQGLRAAQNSAAARGLGLSGAAIKAATGYATGLADSTYQNQFNNAVTNQQNAYSRLYGVTGLGQSAAAGQATANLLTGNNIAQTQIGAGNAQGAASIAQGNAYSSGAQSLGQYINRLLSGTSLGGGMYGNNQVSDYFGNPRLTTGNPADWA